jgi:iron complex outermembrane receptor protein
MKSTGICFANLRTVFKPFASAIVLTTALIGQAVLAQVPSEGATSGIAEPTDDIVVTARRRAEDPQHVPIPLSVFGGADLEERGFTNLEQLQRQAPSLQIMGQNPRNANINIRGLGANVGFASDGLENGVGVYIDDVYYARTGQALFDLVDLDRIEVLRGPQGTLFGKNTTAGALSIYTRAPQFKSEMIADATIGSRGTYRVRGTINAPIIDGLIAARFTAAQTGHGGYLTNITRNEKVNDNKNLSLRGQLLLTPSPDLSVRLIADYGRQTNDGLYGSIQGKVTKRIDGSDLPRPFDTRAAQLGYVLQPVDPFNRRTEGDVDGSMFMKQGGISAKADWTILGATLTSITAVRWWEWDPRNDADGTALPILTAAQLSSWQHQVTQELRLASNGTHTIDYVVGAFYFHQRLRSEGLTRYGSAAPIYVLGQSNPVTQAALVGWGVGTASLLKTNSYAGFGQATWHIDHRLSLTGGVRYTHEEKNGAFRQFWDGGTDLGTLPGAVAAAATGIRNAFGGINSFSAETRENKVTGQVNLAYQVTDDALLFATYARGYKSGGISLTNIAPGLSRTVKPEQINHYEAGVKTNWLDRKLTFNATAFWTKDANYQASLYDQDRATTYVANVGTVRSRGFEIETALRPVSGFSAYVSGAFTDAAYLSYKAAPCPIEYQGLQTLCDLSGRRLPGVSKWSAASGVDYEHPVAGALTGYGGLDVSYRSANLYASNLAASSRIAGYALVNGRIGVRAGQGWDIQIFVRNLLNKGYYITSQPGAFASGLVSGLIGEPRIVGLTGRFQY